MHSANAEADGFMVDGGETCSLAKSQRGGSADVAGVAGGCNETREPCCSPAFPPSVSLHVRQGSGFMHLAKPGAPVCREGVLVLHDEFV